MRALQRRDQQGWLTCLFIYPSIHLSIHPSVYLFIHYLSISIRRFTIRSGSCRRKWQPIQYSCLENPMDRGAWQATIHGVASRGRGGPLSVDYKLESQESWWCNPVWVWRPENQGADGASLWVQEPRAPVFKGGRERAPRLRQRVNPALPHRFVRLSASELEDTHLPWRGASAQPGHSCCDHWCSKGLLLSSDSLVAQTVKRLPTMRETRVRSLGWEDPLEKEMATHSSTLA